MKRAILFALLCFGFLVFFVLVSNAVIYLTTTAHIYNDLADAPSAEVAIIPGAAIFEGGALSSIFLDRADMAIKLYEAKKVTKILVSGDNSTDSHNEVNPVRLYLMSRNIPQEDIYLDHAGFDTYSSMYRARDIFGVSSALVSTQSFHLPRAVFIARRLGIEAYGMNADVGHMLLSNSAREVLANEKAMLDLLFRRKPKYLGEPVPISGNPQERN